MDSAIIPPPSLVAIQRYVPVIFKSTFSKVNWLVTVSLAVVVLILLLSISVTAVVVQVMLVDGAIDRTVHVKVTDVLYTTSNEVLSIDATGLDTTGKEIKCFLYSLNGLTNNRNSASIISRTVDIT